MELYLKVRRAHFQDGLSGRQISRDFGISRDSVAKMLSYSEPPGYRRTAEIKRPKLDAYVDQIDHWLDFLCRVMQVTSRGFRAWRRRPMSQRQRDDMVLLAHIREQHRLSLQSYGRPRMTEELQELGLKVGHRRVGRLMRQNGISVVRTRKHKVMTDSDHTFNIAPNLLDQDFAADDPNQKWAGDISYI